MNNRKKKMVFLFPHSPNPRMLKRIDALKDNFEIEVIYWNRGISSEKDNKIPSGINHKVITNKESKNKLNSVLFTRLKVALIAIKEIRNMHPDYIYISKTDMLLVGQLYKKVFKKDVELIYEVSDLHSLMIDDTKSFKLKFFQKTLYFFERNFCRNIKLLVVTSEYFYDYYYKKFIEEEKVLFIPNTPKEEVFKQIKKVKNKYLTIGFIGVIRYAKQIEMLIDAAQEVEIKVLIAGNGDDYLRIKRYVKNKKNVEIYGSYNYDEEIKMLYEKIDIVYSVYDLNMKNVQYALPNRLYEGIFTQTPIIAAKETYLGEIVNDYNIGEIIIYDNIQELTEVIKKYKTGNNLNMQKENMLLLKDKWQLDRFNEKLNQLLL